MEGCEEALAGARRPPVALVVVEHLAQQRDGLLDGLGGGHGGAERRPRRGDDAGVEVDGPAARRGGEERLARGPELADGLLERCVCRVRAPAGVLPRVRRDAVGPERVERAAARVERQDAAEDGEASWEETKAEQRAIEAEGRAALQALLGEELYAHLEEAVWGRGD